MKKTASHRKGKAAARKRRHKAKEAEIEEPGRTPGSAEGEREDGPAKNVEEPRRTPGSAEGE